ncbi:MAG TPA: lamin tail domain-containing protein [Verrucomicrobiota bacterium]|nr:lamin tail domain-containing protein [Verrucomicrobiota bacterium]HNU49516.1 lamin tail domain-containing protein [Verrucomicrobiota bacterium]
MGPLDSAHALPPPAITEFMASNTDTLEDEDGDSSDWIEIHNPGSEPLDLGGWYLTDDPEKPTKWEFPPTNLPPGGFLVVFASEKNRRDPGLPLHTNFKLDAGGEYLALIDPGTNAVSAFAPAYPLQAADVAFGIGSSTQTVPLLTPASPSLWLVPANASLPAGWTDPDFAAAGWNPGTCAVGYEDSPADYATLITTDVRSSMRNRNATCLLRIPFVIDDLAGLSGFRMQIRYDDGFVVWLNGEPVADRNAQEPLTGTSGATANHPDNQAVVPQMFDLRPFADRFTVGTNWIAVHGLNYGTGSSDFLFHLTLEADRAVTQTTAWQYLLLPTPGEPNSGGTSQLGPLLTDLQHQPAVPQATDPLAITVRVTPMFGTVTRVDLVSRVLYASETVRPMADDGAHGDGAAGDGVYGAILPPGTATAGQMIRYAVIASDDTGSQSRLPLFLDPLDSPQYAGTLVADPAIASLLPVFHLWVENPSASESWNGTRASVFFGARFYDNIRIRLRGQSSAHFSSKKGHNLDFNKGARFEYRPGATPVKDIKLLTNYGDKSRVRNALAYDFITASGSIGHFAFPVRVQRNGRFHAILDMMEDGDDRWMERFGRDPNGALYKIYNALDSVGGAEKKTRKFEGTSDLQALISNLAESQSLSTRVRYAYDRLDLPQIVSYFAALALVSSQDHGHKNFYVYCDTLRTGEWSILPWDVDLSWGRNWIDSAGYFTDTLYQDNVLNFYNSAQQGKPANRLYNLIFQHPDFRRMYLRRLRSVMDAWLRPPGTPADQLPIEARIREHLDLLDPPTISPSDAQLDYNRWGSWGNGNTTRPEAQRIIDIHLPGRRQFLYENPNASLGGDRIPSTQPTHPAIRFLAADFKPASGNQDQEYVLLTNREPVAIDLSGWQLAGGIRFTFRPGTVIPAGGSLYVSPNPAAFRTRTTAPTGGQGLFVQGSYSGQLSARGETLFLSDSAGSPMSEFSYEGAPSPAQNALRITEIHFRPTTAGAPDTEIPEEEFVELKNTSPDAIDLRGIRFTNGIRFAFPTNTPTFLAAGAFLVVAADPAAFQRRYGPNVPVAGPFTGRLENRGETLRLEDPDGEVILDFAFDTEKEPLALDAGHSLVVRDPAQPWTAWDDPAFWRASANHAGSPGLDDPEPGPQDNDADGLPDDWEIEHQLDPNRDDALEDPDRDDASNAAEYAADTDPQDPASRLELHAAIQPDGRAQLQFHARAGRSYELSARPDLEHGPWILQKSWPARQSHETLEYTDLPSANQFYRLTVRPTP